jgi:hypothetical protein
LYVSVRGLNTTAHRRLLRLPSPLPNYYWPDNADLPLFPFLAVILAHSFGTNAVVIPAHTSETLAQSSAESLDLTPDWSINWDLTINQSASPESGLTKLHVRVRYSTLLVARAL